MTAHHAVEITLTRPATAGELRHARRIMPLAANSDRTRLMAVTNAKGPGDALRLLRRSLDTCLPIDVLTTHYPNRHGQVLLNVELSNAVTKILRAEAAAARQRPRDLLGRRVIAALARDAQERARRLENRLESLLVQYTAEDVLSGVAELVRLRRHPPAAP
ncbi:hypothetical protein ACIO13_23820 [Streptomyces sp. NPDC087425]|uniref:hypothetical protein n=1 Tax=Streptomyces sp. NPDC087425 TaxID=3365787 RepID=UPI003825B60F